MSHLTQRDIEILRPELDRIVEKVLGDTDGNVRAAIEKCLYSGYDRKRTTEKLNTLVDSKKAGRIYDKLQDVIDEHKMMSKVKKRLHDDGDDKVTKKLKTNNHETNDVKSSTTIQPPAATMAAAQAVAAAVAAQPTPKNDGNLTSQQISMMMKNAQREIEERKKALTTLKTKEPSNPEDVERAKKIAFLQAQIKAKLSGTLSAIIPPVPVVQEKPKPLILDDQGRTVDNSGRAISIPTLAPTLKANIRAKKKENFSKTIQSANDRQLDDASLKFVDERITAKPALRNKRNLRFHEPGKFQQMADKLRMKAQLEKLQNEISQIARKTGISSATKLALIAPKQDSHAEDVPQMEWWDSVILSQDLKTMDGDHIAIRESAITNLIEHPTQMKPPSKLEFVNFSNVDYQIDIFCFFFLRR